METENGKGGKNCLCAPPACEYFEKVWRIFTWFFGVCPTLCEVYSIILASAPNPAAERTEKGIWGSGRKRTLSRRVFKPKKSQRPCTEPTPGRCEGAHALLLLFVHLNSHLGDYNNWARLTQVAAQKKYNCGFQKYNSAYPIQKKKKCLRSSLEFDAFLESTQRWHCSHN